jgi:hypothetical protein
VSDGSEKMGLVWERSGFRSSFEGPCHKTLFSLDSRRCHDQSLDHDEVRMLTMLRMNKCLMEYMWKEYDNLHSHIETSETRINKDLRDKVEVEAQEVAVMDEEY